MTDRATEPTDEEIARELCHRLCNDCVMVTNPERPKCTPENCMTMAALRSARLAERERCVKMASLFTVKEGASIYPDVPFSEMNDAAQTAAHTTAQQIAAAIRETDSDA